MKLALCNHCSRASVEGPIQHDKGCPSAQVVRNLERLYADLLADTVTLARLADRHHEDAYLLMAVQRHSNEALNVVASTFEVSA
jgi:hypothetical protein